MGRIRSGGHRLETLP